MDATQARMELESMVAANDDPRLDERELATLLRRARRPDADGNSPDSDDWSPTWNLDAAAAQGWRLKAGKCANRITFTSDGQTFNRREMFAHCMQMARMYERRGGNGSTRIVDAD